jgi:hypothetical protein
MSGNWFEYKNIGDDRLHCRPKRINFVGGFRHKMCRCRPQRDHRIGLTLWETQSHETHSSPTIERKSKHFPLNFPRKFIFGGRQLTDIGDSRLGDLNAFRSFGRRSPSGQSIHSLFIQHFSHLISQHTALAYSAVIFISALPAHLKLSSLP